MDTSGFTPVILAHAGAALAALVLGIGVFGSRKGTPVHRMAGRIWVVLMLVTAISSFWIRANGHFSWIHGLSVAVPVLLAMGVYFAIKGNVKRHQKVMSGVFTGGLVVAGIFTLLPQRLLGKLLWSSVGLI